MFNVILRDFNETYRAWIFFFFINGYFLCLGRSLTKLFFDLDNFGTYADYLTLPTGL